MSSVQLTLSSERSRMTVLLQRTPTQTASRHSASLPVHELVFFGLPMTHCATSHGDICLNVVGSMLPVSAPRGRVLPAPDMCKAHSSLNSIPNGHRKMMSEAQADSQEMRSSHLSLKRCVPILDLGVAFRFGQLSE